MPNVMVALPNIGGALYSTPQSVAGAHYYMPCSDAAKTRNQLKCGGVPQSNETISAASGLRLGEEKRKKKERIRIHRMKI